MYEEGNSTAIETLISAENFSDLLNKAEYVQNVHSYDRKQLQEYIDTKQQIADLKAQLEEDQANLESMQSDYEAEQTTLSNTLESKKEEVADLDEQLQATWCTWRTRCTRCNGCVVITIIICCITYSL